MYSPLLSKLSRQDMINSTSQAYFSRGESYFRSGMVLEIDFIDVSGEKVSFESVVQGSREGEYYQDVNIRLRNGHLYIAGHCDCPVGYNCKHVVAACLQACANNGVATEKDDSTVWQTWIDDLNQACIPPETRPLPQAREFIIYHLILEERHPYQLIVEFFTSRILKKGGLGKNRPLSADRIEQNIQYSSVSYIQEVDRDIFQLLSKDRNHYYWDKRFINGSTGYLALTKLMESGRCFFRDGKTLKPLQLSDSRELAVNWKSQSSGHLQLEIEVVPPSKILLTDPPCYIDTLSACFGVIDKPFYTREQLQKLLNAPQIPANAIDAFSQSLVEKVSTDVLHPPKPVAIETIEGVTPIPYLLLAGVQWGEQLIHTISLQFIYGDHVVPCGGAVTEVIRHDGKIIRVSRDIMAEQAAGNKLESLGFSARIDSYTDSLIFIALDNTGHLAPVYIWSEFLNETVPNLEKLGWRIEYDESFNLAFHEADTWDIEIEEQTNDWFNLNFEVEVNGKPMALLPLITKIFNHYDPEDLPEILIFNLGDGQHLNIPAAQLKPIIDTLYELYDSESLQSDGSLRLSRFDAPRLSDLDEQSDNIKWRGGEALRKLGSQLKDFTGVTQHPPPAGLKATLRSYQQHGLNWLQFLREYGFAGILADDMGLGKTIQTIAHILLEKEQGRLNAPCLIIAPTSLMHNWRREIESFAPELSCLVLQGADRHAYFEEITSHDIILSTYPLIVRDEEQLLAHSYYMLVLDEAQVVKNPKAKAAQLIRTIKTDHRLCLTGTPMENHLGELWALFDFLMPGFLGTSRQFNNIFRTPIEKQNKTEQRERLANRVAPFMLRRAKADVATELPDKTEIIHRVSLGKKQATLYESIRVAMEQKVKQAIAEKGLARSHITILDALLKLRQTCCDPRLLKLSQARTLNESAKLELLMQILPDMVEEGRRVLLFSQFTTMLGYIEEALKKQKIKFSKLTGQTRNRDQAIDLFKSGDVPVFLISLKAGGVGLNLTEADTVIHYDPWWNPAVENQATDRAHRIGQDKAVFVYKFVVENSVEEKILEMQSKKAALAEAVYKNNAQSEEVKLDKDDLQQLFAPLDA